LLEVWPVDEWLKQKMSAPVGVGTIKSTQHNACGVLGQSHCANNNGYWVPMPPTVITISSRTLYQIPAGLLATQCKFSITCPVKLLSSPTHKTFEQQKKGEMLHCPNNHFLFFMLALEISAESSFETVSALSSFNFDVMFPDSVFLVRSAARLAAIDWEIRLASASLDARWAGERPSMSSPQSVQPSFGVELRAISASSLLLITGVVVELAIDDPRAVG
jgi:hypothetical protein